MAPASLCVKRKFVSKASHQREFRIVVLLNYFNISDDGFGSFQLFTDKQLKVNIVTSGRDAEMEESLTLDVS